MDLKPLQAALGVNADGIFGPVSFTALFVKCGASIEIAEELALSANVHFERYGMLQNGLRLAHFMAQLIHESDHLRAMEEYASGADYEGRKDLGNTRAGDGRRFKGRGPIQLTGRANYRTYGKRLGFDFERHPEIVAVPSVGLLVALEYWAVTHLNDHADRDDIEAVTRRINGGTNGLADRKRNLARLKEWMA